MRHSDKRGFKSRVIRVPRTDISWSQLGPRSDGTVDGGELIFQVQYLKAKDQILRKRLPKNLRVAPRERAGRVINVLVMIVHPRTISEMMPAIMQWSFSRDQVVRSSLRSKV